MKGNNIKYTTQVPDTKRLPLESTDVVASREERSESAIEILVKREELSCKKRVKTVGCGVETGVVKLKGGR